MSGLYIHIPYCHSKCAYCDFYCTPKREGLDELVAALADEWSMRKRELPDAPTTLYLGGGTPSIVPIDVLARLVEGIGVGDWEEATIECNPEDVTPQWIEGVRRLGFNRVSMGVQSLDDGQLRFIGRRHTAEEATQAAKMLMASGLKVSLDLIYGLPGQTLESWRRSLDGVLELRPDHLSAYLLSYEPGTRLWAMLQAGKVVEASEELAEAMYGVLCRRAAEEGYEHYEVSNFAQPGCRAVHNSRYWDGSTYLGLGPGAHSFDGIMRRVNPPSIARYMGAISRGETPFEIDEETEIDRVNDMIITRLRTVDGLSVEELTRRYGPAIADGLLADASPWLADGALLYADHRLVIAEPSWLRSDAIMRDLLRI